MPGVYSPQQYQKAVRICWIISAIGFVIAAVGTVFCVQATTNDQQAFSVLAIVLGGIVGLAMLFVGFMTRQNGKAVAALEKGQGEIWARWTCSAEEAARFVEAERTRMTITSSQRWKILLGAAALGIVSTFIYKISNPDVSLGQSAVVLLIFVGLVGPILLLASRLGASEVKRAAARASGETLISADGLLTSPTFYPWRSFNWGLRAVTFEAGNPAVVQFDFLAGTIPGSGAVQTAGQAAYILGVSQQMPGRTQQKEQIRVPVPKDKEEEARQIVQRLNGVPVEDPASAEAP